MPVSELLVVASEVMLLGMGVVFTFLGVLVVVVTYMSKLAHLIGGAEDEIHAGVTPQITRRAQPSPMSDPDLMAVLNEAVNRYRSERGA